MARTWRNGDRGHLRLWAWRSNIRFHILQHGLTYESVLLAWIEHVGNVMDR